MESTVHRRYLWRGEVHRRRGVRGKEADESLPAIEVHAIMRGVAW